SQADWQGLFQKYRQTPEFQQINSSLSLDQFKPIFWMEYVHRLWGRIIGLVFFVPFVVLAARRKIERRLWPPLAFAFVLGSLQGLMGWIMVRSGLSDRPSVSQYLLTAHLGLACILYGYLLWLALDLYYAGRNEKRAGATSFVHGALGLVALIFTTVLAGGFVAGLKAGFAYNTFPLMDGHFIPDGIFALQPWYINFFENIATVQFTHRILAMTTFFYVTVFWLAARRQYLGDAALPANLLFAFVVIQVGLGISTLLLVVPMPLAAAHQAGALALYTAGLWVTNRLWAQRVRPI
ncbi:MAG: COX15/CtaA family protein, partial [Alphaproteobacteria bacterium]